MLEHHLKKSILYGSQMPFLFFSVNFLKAVFFLNHCRFQKFHRVLPDSQHNGRQDSPLRNFLQFLYGHSSGILPPQKNVRILDRILHLERLLNRSLHRNTWLVLLQPLFSSQIVYCIIVNLPNSITLADIISVAFAFHEIVIFKPFNYFYSAFSLRI